MPGQTIGSEWRTGAAPWRRGALSAAVLLFAAACGRAEEESGRAIGVEGAHEHAVARANIAVEGDGATLQLIAPADGIYGFEHEPRSDEERQQQQDALAALRQRVGEMFVFDPSLQCRIEERGVAESMHDHGDDHDHDHGDDGHDHHGTSGDTTAGGHTHGGVSGQGGGGHGQDTAHAHGGSYPEGYTHDPAHHPEQAGGVHVHEAGAGHREVQAEFEVRCAGSLAGTRMGIELGRVFPRFEDVDLQVLSADRQFGRRIAATGTSVEL